MGFEAVIGIDCATQPRNIGLARAVRVNERWRLAEVVDGSSSLDPATMVAAWLEETPCALLALDAPLGWPRRLGASLVDHDAGEPLAPDSDQLFSRDTDRHVHALHGKKPLEVYPAATLRAHGVSAKGYKKDGRGPGRVAIRGLLECAMDVPSDVDLAERSADAIDATLCVVAGIDVVSGRARAPSDEQLAAARREGWIWVAEPKT